MNNLSSSHVQNSDKKKLLLCMTGSVASILVKEFVEYAYKENYELKIVLTNSAKVFADDKIGNYREFSQKMGCEILTDSDEWANWNEHKTVLHIRLRNWADYLLIAPLSANTLSKISNGVSDNLLTCIVKAWQPSKPVFFALAMNTQMYRNPLTQNQRLLLTKTLYFNEIGVATKILKCNEKGEGALAQISDIFMAIRSYEKQTKITKYFKPNKIISSFK